MRNEFETKKMLLGRKGFHGNHFIVLTEPIVQQDSPDVLYAVKNIETGDKSYMTYGELNDQAEYVWELDDTYYVTEKQELNDIEELRRFKNQFHG